MAETDPFLRLLDLAPDGEDRFLAVTPGEGEGPARLFGGQVASQSLRAATLTVDGDRPPHSMHAYFIRPGRPGSPLELQVHRDRDGRSFTTRRVTASQEGVPIFVLSASFHTPEDGFEFQAPPRDDYPGPDVAVEMPAMLKAFRTMGPIEIRPVLEGSGATRTLHPFWIRIRNRLPDDRALHVCALAFMSDFGMVASARADEPEPMHRFSGASLDHSLWFHRPFRADEWLLFDVWPVSNFGARGLAIGAMRTLDGTLVASVAQEALIRPTGTPALP